MFLSCWAISGKNTGSVFKKIWVGRLYYYALTRKCAIVSSSNVSLLLSVQVPAGDFKSGGVSVLSCSGITKIDQIIVPAQKISEWWWSILGICLVHYFWKAASIFFRPGTLSRWRQSLACAVFLAVWVRVPQVLYGGTRWSQHMNECDAVVWDRLLTGNHSCIHWLLVIHYVFWHSLSVCLQEVALCVMCTADNISVFICACVEFAHYWVGFTRRRWSVCVLYK